VFAGDPDQPGPCAVRLKIPRQFKIAPHFTFFTEPPGLRHFAMTRCEEVMQLDAIGPTGTVVLDDQHQD